MKQGDVQGLDPLNPTGGYPHRPIEPVRQTAAALTKAGQMTEEARRLAFLHEMGSCLVRYGADWVRAALLEMGYEFHEIATILGEIRVYHGRNYLGVDVEHYRAISISRLERMRRMAEEAGDIRNAIAAQKHLDRITGVTQDDGSGGVGALEEITRFLSSAVDAQFVEVEGSSRPAAPPINIHEIQQDH